MNEEIKGKAKGGLARANALSPERRKEIAEKAAEARWGAKLPKATHKGNFLDEFGIDVDCYVLDDENKSAVISQRGMGSALCLGEGGRSLPRFAAGKIISEALGVELLKKIDNPLIFNANTLVGNSASATQAKGYNVGLLIDICNAIVKAFLDEKLLKSQENIAIQAQIILNASAKSGIKGLVYALAGYNPSIEEVIAAFKAYVQEEARKYEKEFPSELYMQWHRLYKIPVPIRGKPWHFKHLTIRHIYFPLAKSNGKILELVRAHKATDGDRQKKLFQFLNEIGARALRIHIGRVLEMSESSQTSAEYENKITERFGGQQELDLVVT